MKSSFNPKINQIMPGITFTKEWKFYDWTEDKYKTTAMFYASDAEPGFDTNPDKIKAFSIPSAGAGFAIRDIGDKIDTSKPGPGYYVIREAYSSQGFSLSRVPRFQEAKSE